MTTTVYHYDPRTNEAIGSDVADLDPLDKKPMVPAHATTVKPPTTIAAGKVAVFNPATNKWSQKEDHRGVVYDTATGAESQYEQLGPLPANLTSQTPIVNGTWDATTKSWVVDVAQVTAEKIEQIKTRRDTDIATLMGIDVGEMDMLKIVYQNTDPAFHTAAMTSAYNIWTYAAGKITSAKTATLAQLDAYDVATDPNWP